MPATTYKETSVKYTTILPKTCIDELKNLADKKIVSSVNQGIRLAVENFVAIQKQQEYANLMQEAVSDESFIKRTMDAQNDFSAADMNSLIYEEEGIW